MPDYYDYSKLLGRLREKGFTQDNLADVLQLSRPTIWTRLSSKTEFRQKEIEKICNFLDIPIADVSAYFFAK